MHPPEVRRRALDLRAELGLSRRTVGNWFRQELTDHWPEPDPDTPRCLRCAVPSRIPADQGAFAYLLGQYLGDGQLVLRLYCTASWPGNVSECRQAMLRVLAKSVHQVNRRGCVAVRNYSSHWPCYLPQHGPGKEHDRRIALTKWQQDIVDRHPDELPLGLFHSDGCRVTKRVTRAGRVVSGRSYR